MMSLQLTPLPMNLSRSLLAPVAWKMVCSRENANPAKHSGSILAYAGPRGSSPPLRLFAFQAFADEKILIGSVTFIDQIFLFFCILSLSFAQFLTSSDEKGWEVQNSKCRWKPLTRMEPNLHRWNINSGSLRPCLDERITALHDILNLKRRQDLCVL
jgi:hypothetical protein